MRSNGCAGYTAAMGEGLTRLIHRVASGDSAAFSDFYENARPLIRAVLRRTLHREDLDAAEQEVAVAVWQDAHKFDRGRASSETWIAMLTRSRALDYARSRAVRKRSEAEVAGDAPYMDEQTPSANFAREELREQMREQVDALPEPQRTLVELSFFVGLSQREIAETLQMPLGTVKTRIRSAFTTLAGVMPPPA